MGALSDQLFCNRDIDFYYPKDFGFGRNKKGCNYPKSAFY